MSDLSDNAKTVIHVACFLCAHLVILSAVHQRHPKKEADVAKPVQCTPAKTGSSSDKVDATSYIRPHEHEKKMTERLVSSSSEDEDGVERTKVVVRVPATSANLGPGFDAIGMALDMWSEIGRAHV